ncbi:MAG: hypothetical protein JWL86_5438 [Rhizobium sp.]|nr:hypothetical protein [Rhizobium sp.]
MPSLVPAGPEHFDLAVHIVLEDYGLLGRAYRETDEAAADEKTLIDDILTCQFEHIVRIIAFNTVEGWSRDVTEDIAIEVAEVARQRGTVLRDGALDLVYRFLPVPA